MRSFVILLLPFLLVAQSVDEILEKLTHLQVASKDLHVSYSPFEETLKNPASNSNEVQNEDQNSQSAITPKAIFNDKVFIKDRWYGKGEKIEDFRIKKIEQTSIVISKDNIQKILTLGEAKKYLEVKER
ncbi:MAG: hypothetical protein IBX44_07080 [Sulfurospirillum sp.]|nr:hypothetical protein [Sulfurospirillum sp.]